jgi:hypothetical protein
LAGTVGKTIQCQVGRTRVMKLFSFNGSKSGILDEWHRCADNVACPANGKGQNETFHSNVPLGSRAVQSDSTSKMMTTPRFMLDPSPTKTSVDLCFLLKQWDFGLNFLFRERHGFSGGKIIIESSVAQRKSNNRLNNGIFSL